MLWLFHRHSLTQRYQVSSISSYSIVFMVCLLIKAPKYRYSREFKMQRQRQQRERQKGNRLLRQTTTLLVHHAFFVHFFCHHCTKYDVKKSHFTFYGGRKQVTTKFSFYFFVNLDMVARDSAPEEFACI